MKMIKLEKEYHLQIYKRLPLLVKEARSSYLMDIKGEKYLDFGTGIGVNSLGHLHKSILEVLKNPFALHISNLYYSPSQIKLAKKLCDLTGFDKLCFVNTGTEANELALKLARKYGKGKFEVISFKNSFHGRTYGSLSIAGQGKYKKGFYPLLPGIKFAKLNDMKDFLKKLSSKTCAVFIETIQGEGGMDMVKKDFIRKLRRITKQRDILLIVDEVQTGMGRTGKFMSYEHFGIKPDIVTLAKALGGGLPLGAVLMREKIAESMNYGDHGSTFAGNPLICEISLKVINVISNKKFLKNVELKGRRLKEMLLRLMEKYKIIKDIKGIGQMLGVEYKKPISEEVMKEFFNRKILVLTSGKYTTRILPPLNVKNSEIDRFVKNFKEILKKMCENL